MPPWLVTGAAALAMYLFVSHVVGSRGGAYFAALIWGLDVFHAAPGQRQRQALGVLLPLVFLCVHRLMAVRRRRGAVRVVSGLALAAVVAAGIAAWLAGADAQDLPPASSGAWRLAALGLMVPALAGAWYGWRSDARPIVTSMIALGVTEVVLSLPATFALATLAALGWREWSADAHHARA